MHMQNLPEGAEGLLVDFLGWREDWEFFRRHERERRENQSDRSLPLNIGSLPWSLR